MLVMKKINNLTNQSLINRSSATKIVLALVTIMIFGLFLPVVEALSWSNTTFNNSLTTEDLTFTGDQNITRWLAIPSSVNVLISGFLNLSGFEYTNDSFEDGVPDQFIETGEFADGWESHNNLGTMYKECDGIISCFKFDGDNVLLLRGSATNGNISKTIFFNTPTGNLSIWYSGTDQLPTPHIGVFINGIFSEDISTSTSSAWVNKNITLTSGNEINLYGNGSNLLVAYLDKFEYFNSDNTKVTPNNVNLSIDNNIVFTYQDKFNHTNNRTNNLANTINSYLSGCTLENGFCLVPFLFHSDTIGILQYLNLVFDNVGFSENSQTYTTPVYDTSRHRFSINFTYDPGRYDEDSTSAVFVYNNSRYSSILSSSSGDNYIYSSTIDIPIVSVSTEIEFYWEINLINSTGDTLTDNSTFYNQTVSPSNLSQCGTAERAVNYTIYSESTLALLTADFDATFVWKLNESSSITKNSSFDLTGANNYQFCINSNETFFTDVAIELSATNYHTKLYDFDNQKFSNATTLQNLYLLNSSSGSTIIIEIKDVGLAPLEGYTIKVYRFIQSTGEYILIHEDVTDVFGQITSKLIENDAKYRIEFYNPSGVLVKSTGDMVVACRTVICVLPFVIEDTTDPFDRFDNVTDLSHVFTFNNETNTFIFTWVDTSGDTATYNLKVERILANGTTTVCDSSTVAASGTLTCEVGDQKASYRAQVFRTVDGEKTRIDILNNVKVGDVSHIYGMEGLFWSFILLFTFMAIGVYSPAAGVGVYLIAFVMLGITGIIYVNPAIIIAQLVIGILFIWSWRG